jgi:hypothetical protein
MILRVLIIVGLIFISSSAMAQEETKTKFYNFDDLLINGEYQKPTVLYTDSKKKMKFEALLSLKKQFIKRLKDTAKDSSLR